MNKQRTNITLDPDVFMFIKQEEITLSELVNNILRLRMKLKEENSDEEDLKKRIKEKNELIETETKYRDEFIVQLEILKQKNEKSMKESIEQMERMADFNRLHNPLREY